MAVTQRTLIDGDRNVVWHVVGVSVAADTKTTLDMSALEDKGGKPVVSVKIEKIRWTVNAHDTAGNQPAHVLIDWDATAAVTVLNLTQGQCANDYSDIGGISNNAGTGVTGDINITPKDQTADFTITIHGIKEY